MVAWVGPKLCPRGHRLGPGLSNLSWEQCSCAGAGDQWPGHNLEFCRVDGCHAHWWPPEHVGRGGRTGNWVSGRLEATKRGQLTSAMST